MCIRDRVNTLSDKGTVARGICTVDANGKLTAATKIANILGPSDIVSDTNHIYSELGVYKTQIGQAEWLDRSVLSNEGNRLTGDSLYYDRVKGYGEAFDNVIMTDTVNKNMLTGDYCYYCLLYTSRCV